MKRTVGALLLLILAIGAFGFAPSMAADCAAPVSIDCTDGKGTATTADDEHCLLYVDVPEGGLKDCIGESDAPPPPVLGL